MNYSVSEVHNVGVGEDVSWCNIKIHDITKDQLDAILALIKPWYDKEVAKELAEHLQWMKEHRPEQIARSG